MAAGLNNSAAFLYLFRIRYLYPIDGRRFDNIYLAWYTSSIKGELWELAIIKMSEKVKETLGIILFLALIPIAIIILKFSLHCGWDC